MVAGLRAEMCEARVLVGSVSYSTEPSARAMGPELGQELGRMCGHTRCFSEASNFRKNWTCSSARPDLVCIDSKMLR